MSFSTRGRPCVLFARRQGALWEDRDRSGVKHGASPVSDRVVVSQARRARSKGLRQMGNQTDGIFGARLDA